MEYICDKMIPITKLEKMYIYNSTRKLWVEFLGVYIYGE